eukprot:364111-Chlamydomonas_euryale.AAC.17
MAAAVAEGRQQPPKACGAEAAMSMTHALWPGLPGGHAHASQGSASGRKPGLGQWMLHACRPLHVWLRVPVPSVLKLYWFANWLVWIGLVLIMPQMSNVSCHSVEYIIGKLLHSQLLTVRQERCMTPCSGHRSTVDLVGSAQTAMRAGMAMMAVLMRLPPGGETLPVVTAEIEYP